MSMRLRPFLSLAVLVGCALAAGCVPPVDTSPAGGSDGGTVTPPTIAPPPQGSWKVASAADGAAAGFQTVVLDADGSYTQTGRTDEEAMDGAWTQPASVPVDSSFGNPPAGIHGPYLELSNNPKGDGQWDYGWVEASDASTLTLTLYAQRFGMGLRWATVTTINLVAN